jgi:hypothetical protein
MRMASVNFSKGEIAEDLIARVDVQSYSSAVKTARNVLVLKYGGLTKRPGTRLVGEAYSSAAPVRLIPFQFSLTQAYALELGQGYMRAAASGGLVIEDELKVTAITNATNALVTAAFHGYSVGEQVYFSQITGMVEINGRTGTVLTTPTANTFTVNINTTAFSTFTGSNGIVRTGAPAAPPTPPAVPPPPPPPPPPSTGSGSGYGTGGTVRHGYDWGDSGENVP